jgi:DNA-directed RNA polymerase subunit RPC12/RpoP
MRMRPYDRYRCHECGFEAEVTRLPRATSASDETLCCCGGCGAEIEIDMKTSAAADQDRSPRIPQAVSAA